MQSLLRLPSSLFLGLIFIFFVVIVLVTNRFEKRWDVTQDQRHSLTEGSRQLLAELERPVTIRYYLSSSENRLPIKLRHYSERVDDFLDTITQAANRKIIIKRLDPLPDSDAEQSALLDGIEPESLSAEEAIYMGLAIASGKNQTVIPFLNPERAHSFEYDILKEIHQVSRKVKPVLGVISSIPVNQPEKEWQLFKRLKESYEVVNVTVRDSFPEMMNTLLIIHPKKVPVSFEKKLDAFVRSGGSLIVLLDSLSVAMNLLNLADTPSELHSDWPALKKVTGLHFTSDQGVLDMIFSTDLDRGEGLEKMPSFLSLNQNGLNPSHPITQYLSQMDIPIAGTFLGEPHASLKMTTLLSSTVESQLEKSETILLSNRAETARMNSLFQSDDRTYPLALLLEGPLPSFQDGTIQDGQPTTKIILVADTDFIADPYAGYAEEIQGKEYFNPTNNNFGFVLNSLDYLQNTTQLNDARGRTKTSRPLLKLTELEQEVEAHYQSRVAELENTLKQIEDTGNNPNFRSQGKNAQTMSAEYRQLLERRNQEVFQAETELRALRRGLREETQALKSTIKWINIGSVPSLILLISLFFLRRRFRNASAL